MRIGILTGRYLSRNAHAMAESLREKGLDLVGIVSIDQSPWVPRDLVALRSAIKRRGVVGSIMLWKRRKSRATVQRTPSVAVRNAGTMQRTPAKAYARSNGLRFWRSSGVNTRRTARILRTSGVDIVVACGVGILRPIILDVPGVTFINAHAGELPLFGGMNVVEWAVLLDRAVFGTVHRIDSGIDTGDILLERPLDLRSCASLAELRERAFSQVWAMVPGALSQLERGEIEFRAQSDHESRRLWYRMHSCLRVIAEEKLSSGRFTAVQQRALSQQGS